MKKLPVVIVLIAGMIFSSCSKKFPDFVNSIPDDAIAVASLHPMKLHKKGQINTLENLKQRVKDEVWEMILEDPLSTGLMLDEYTFIFVRMEKEAPIIGVVTGMSDMEKFEVVLGNMKEDASSEFVEMEGYSFFSPEKEGAIAWNKEQMIVLSSPDNDEFEASYWIESFDKMFHPVKEESITSLVNFNDFLGKMKDLNAWISSNEMRQLVEKIMNDNEKIDINLPVELYNNYAQVYCEFAEGAMYVNGETYFSEEVEKNIEELLVLNPSLNEEMLKLAPGGHLLLALAGSMDLDKAKELVKKVAPPELGEVGSKVEAATGVPAQELLNAFTGDFIIAVNGIEEDVMIPIEIFIGLGVNNEVIQEKLLENLENLLPVEKQEDFFVINIQGNEIYSGIINDAWVITNAKGYRDAVSDSKLEKSLMDSKFNDFADGSLGMYLNLDLSSYPAMIQGSLSKNPEQNQWLEYVTESFEYLGMSAGNNQNRFTLETTKSSENSLYTILKLTDIPE